MAEVDPERIRIGSELTPFMREQADERPSHPADGWIMMIALVPVKTDVERRHGDWRRKHLNRNARRKYLRKPTWNYRNEIGIRHDHRQHVQPRHTKRDVPSDPVRVLQP